MNLLYLAHRIPFPPDKGDKLRAFRQIEHLARNHTVWCACFVDDPLDQRHVAAFSQQVHKLATIPLNRLWSITKGLAGLLAGHTVTECFYRNAAMKALLRRWSDSVRFDAIIAFSSGMAPHALHVTAPRRVLDLCDLDSEKWKNYANYASPPMRWLYRLEGQRLAAAERRWTSRFDAVTLVTEAEAAPFRAALDRVGSVRSKVHVIGNGVALPPPSSPPLPREGPREGSTIGFVGVMNYRPNVDAVCWFVDQCWPRIRARWPLAVFRIVGRSPSKAVRKLARVAGVEVVGAVEDVLNELRNFDVSVAPLRIARGIQNKVLEAMAAAKPVVLSPCAAEGTRGRNDEHFLIATTPDEWIAAVSRLLESPNDRIRIGQQARRFVAEHHRWEVELRKLETIVTDDGVRTAPIAEVTPTQLFPTTRPALTTA